MKDYRSKCPILVDYDYDTKRTVIRYNPRYLKNWDFPLIVSGVFHEIGHIMQGSLPYDTEEEQIYAEWDAEAYSLRMMRKYYTKKEVNEVIRYCRSCLKNPRWRKKAPIHYEAFKQIKEYN